MSEYLTVKSAIQKNNNELIINGIKRNDLVLVSKYGLSYYDVARSPRKINYLYPGLITVEKLQSVIKEVFSCSICLSTMTDPINSIVCLHRFCKDCLNYQIRKVKKECPICKKKIDNMRSTRTNIHLSNIKKFNELEEKNMKNNLSFYIQNQKERSIALKSQINNNNLINNNLIKCQREKQPIIPLIEENIDEFPKFSAETSLLFKKSQREISEDILIPTKRLKPDIKVITNTHISQSDLKKSIMDKKDYFFMRLICNEKNENYQFRIILNNIDFVISDLKKYISKYQSFSSKNFLNINYFLEIGNQNRKIDKDKNLREVLSELNNNFPFIIKIIFNFLKI